MNTMKTTELQNTNELTRRKATWLELFYDLAYVAIIAKVVHHLVDYMDNPFAYFLAMLAMFPIWWSWAGHTYFANHFDRNDTTQNIFVLIQLFGVICLASSIDSLFHRHAEAFIYSYLLIRTMLVVMYCRECFLNEDQARLITNIICGSFLAITLWVTSLFLDLVLRYIAWGVAIAIDMITIILCKRDFQTQNSMHKDHLAERTGLFTIIMLGEVIVALVSFIDVASLSYEMIALASTSFITLCLMWWLFFSNCGRVYGKEPYYS